MIWSFKSYEHNVAMIDESGRKITYGELEEMQKVYNSYMDSDRSFVFLICDLAPESLIIYISCIQNRIPLMILDNSLSKEVIDKLLESYRPKYVWYFGEAIHFAGYEIKKAFDGFWLYFNKAIDVMINDELALLLLTSGSTGSRKSVRISYRNIEANMSSIAKSLDLNETDTAMAMLPMCYSYGLSVINSNLFVGATLLVPKSRFFSVNFWDFFQKYHGTSICGVPYTYEVLQRLKFHEKNLPSLRLITQAGGALGIQRQKYFLDYAQSRGINIAIMYGQTEATARISCYFLNHHRDKIGCVGKAIPNGKIEIRDRDKAGRGEVVYMGENVTLGYAESADDLTKGDENKGVLYTGDIGYLDKDGYLYIVGRKNRIAKIHGVRLNLDELQELLSRECGFSILCVEKKEKVVIFVKNGEDIGKISDVLREMKMDIRIFEIMNVEEFPREENGKISYRKALQLAKESFV